MNSFMVSRETQVTFVDTSAWYALYVWKDLHHVAAATWLKANRQPLLTTDYVIDETLTLMRSHDEGTVAIEFGTHAFEQRLATIHSIASDEIAAAWQVFRDYDDKDWSFTDCTSKVVMERHKIATAFTFDHHFRQFGTVAVAP
jgi:hypothetical protein